MASKFVETGKFLEPEALKGVGGAKRWFAGQMLRGALAGGILPLARHALERRAEDAANERLRRTRYRRERSAFLKGQRSRA